ncbi:methyl-accepting chemotaxis protein [Lysinibacillus sp. 54212]|uniref:methyl-accepting chemotaxis protein n=1 Tax=Lysinibacillus sp. 54212 TaxID=3119829 RepID=UPI002FC972D8
MSIRTRGLLSFVFIFFTLIIVGIVQYNNADSQMKHLKKIENTTLQTTFLTEELKLAVVQVQQYLTDISATRGQDGLNDGFELAEKHSQIVYKNLNELKELQPENLDRLNEIEEAFNAYYQSGIQMAQNYIDGGPEQGNKIMGEFDETSITINSMVDELKQESVAQTKNGLQNIQQIINDNTNFFIMTFSFVIFIGIIIALLLSRSIINPLKQIILSTEKIAKGDLGTSVLLNRKDELGKLAEAFEKMRLELRSLITKIDEASDKMLSNASLLVHNTDENVAATEDITTAMQNVSDGAESQSTNLAHSSNYLEEISQGMYETTKSVQTVTDLSLHAKETAQSGNEVVQQTLQQIHTIQQTVGHANNVVSHLGNKSQEINQIISIITDIADQTNLLALNAAIESARAGEHGKGFAVVADEVRKLAEQSSHSANNIRLLINEIQMETEKAIQSMTGGIKAVEVGSNLAEKTGDEFNNITNIIEKISRQTLDVFGVVEEINTNTTNIAETINHISTISESLANNAQHVVEIATDQYESSVEISTSVANLNDMAKDLKNTISEFKL